MCNPKLNGSVAVTDFDGIANFTGMYFEAGPPGSYEVTFSCVPAGDCNGLTSK